MKIPGFMQMEDLLVIVELLENYNFVNFEIFTV